MIKTALAALGVVCLAGAALPAGNPVLEKTDVFTARTGGYFHYRVPGIVVSARGTVLAYCEARKTSGDWADIDILLKRSTDGGRTWSRPIVLADGSGFEGFNPAAARFRKGERAGAVTCNNVVTIVDGDGKTIHCLHCIEYARCFYSRSVDDGRTFTAPVEITSTFDKFRSEYAWKVLATSPGHGVQLRSGRLLVPVWLSTGEGGGGHRPSCVSVVYSDDGGVTWNRGEIVVNDPELKNPSETLPLELADGRVMLNIRNESPEHRRAIAFSRDGATGWTRPEFHQSLYEPVCMASTIRLSGALDDGRGRILFANPDSQLIPQAKRAPGGRQNVTVKLSYDEGTTWPKKKVLEEGPSGYTDLAVGTDGTIYCVYERGAADPARGAYDPAAVTVARFNLEWLTGAGDSLPAAPNRRAAAPVDADVLLAGGTIYDGAGGPSVTGDVAIRDGRIAAVGSFPVGKVDRVIDCNRLVVTPGFIDLHTHSDKSIVKDKTRLNLNYLTQGCTTVVTGNCGSGPRDTKAYFDQIDQQGAGSNVIHLVPHGAVRRAVMGSANRPPAPDEMERMKELVDQAMTEGAWGLSTGLIYIPSCYADTDELVELCQVVARHKGIYVSHIRNEAKGLCDSVREAIEIGSRANVPVHISHFKSSGVPNWGRLRDAVQIIRDARRAGQVITADQYPYIASSTSLAATLLPDSALPGGRANLLERLEGDPDLQRRVREVIARRLADYRAIMIDSCKITEYTGRKLDEIAEAEQVDVVDLVLKIHKAGGAHTVNFSMSEEDVRYGMTLPWVATASDGWARNPDPSARFHPRNFGTFPRKVGRYAGQQNVISMPQAIRSCTGLPADILGLTDRGYLRPGAVADVLVLDPEEFMDRATFEEPAQYSSGLRYLFIAGNLALEGHEPSQKLHGRVIRHSR